MPPLPERIGRSAVPRGFLLRWLNQLRDHIEGTRVVAGPGLSVRRTQEGVAIGLDRVRRTDHLEATITAVHLVGASPYQTIDVSYSAQARWMPEVKLEQVFPKYGRPVSPDGAVIPCQVGDECVIIRSRDESGTPFAHLWVISEQAHVVADCDP